MGGGRGALGQRVAASKTLIEYVADYHQALQHKGATARHAGIVQRRLLKLFERAGVRYWSDLSASTVQAAVARMTQPARVKGDDGRL